MLCGTWYDGSMDLKFSWLYLSRVSILVLTVLLPVTLVFSGCAGGTQMKSTSPSPQTRSTLGAGFRYSPYGPSYDPGVEYWARVGQEMVSRFPGSTPEVIWIVSVVEGQGTRLTFPGNSPDPNITFSEVDENQATLTLFDQLGFRVWLQVEPGDASVEKLFDLILARYGSHPCVVGVGVDVEWHHSFQKPEGTPLTDEEAASWLKAARMHGEQYRLFLKHWETDMLPPSRREGLLFVDDSQKFTSLDKMVAEFAEWGHHFAPAPVAFQFGYPDDKKWWGIFDDPPKVIGDAILAAVPNTAGLYWVDFTVLQVFPP
jgi:hypothetical protein